VTQFSLAPGFLKVRYDDAHRPHFQTLSVIPNGAVVVGDEPRFERRTGAAETMETLVELYAVVLAANLAAATTIVEATFWSKPTEDDDPIWIFTHPLNVAGTAGGTETFTRQVNRSFRTQNGHIMRNVIEGVTSLFGNDVSTPIPPGDAISDFLMGANGFITGRDNGLPAARLNYSVKTNDALRKKELGL
jgi:hypothetical protein